MRPQPLAYLDPAFVESDDGRPLRILAEYLEPLRRFKAQGIQDTVVLFGSARVHSREQAVSELQALQGGHEATNGDLLAQKLKAVEWSRFYEDARTLARLITEWSMSLQTPTHRFVVTSGGGPGIMEAANRGAFDAGGKSIGLNIRLPFEQGANPYITDGLHFEFHYFFMRKFWFAYMAKALVVFPGGFGTLDEMFELLTLAQTEKLEKQIQIVLYGSEYWDPILKFEPMVEWGAIGPTDPDLIQRADTPEAAFEILKAHLITHHLEGPEVGQAAVPGISKTRR
ncbi:MAG TPA: TIGR00730 family Rossman fold protein [Vicinamibacterales bacterium]